MATNIGIWGSVNYSRMANSWFRTYCNTFWNTFGTSKMFTKYWLFTCFINRNHSPNERKDPRTSLNILFFHISTFWVSKTLSILEERAPKHDEDSSKNFCNILDMVPLSIWKMKYNLGNNKLAILITCRTQKTTTIWISMFRILAGPKQLICPKV